MIDAVSLGSWRSEIGRQMVVFLICLSIESSGLCFDKEDPNLLEDQDSVEANLVFVPADPRDLELKKLAGSATEGGTTVQGTDSNPVINQRSGSSKNAFDALRELNSILGDGSNEPTLNGLLKATGKEKKLLSTPVGTGQPDKNGAR